MAGKATQDAAAQARAGVAAAKPPAPAAKPLAAPAAGGALGGWARPAAKPAAPGESPPAEPETGPRGRMVVGTLPGVPIQTGAQTGSPQAAASRGAGGGAPIRRATVSSWPAPPPKEGSAPDVQVPGAAAVGGDVAIAAAGLEERLGELGLSAEQIQGVLALSREVVERVVWEVVPTLAETIIKEEIARLTQD